MIYTLYVLDLVHYLCAKTYRMSPDQREALRREVETLLKLGLIEKSNSPWASPSIIIPKGDNTYCCVIDYRKVNQLVVDEHFPVGNIDDQVDKISGAKVLSRVDLQKSFYQVPLDEASKPITALTTPDWQYQFRRLPFGLLTSPSCFSQRMKRILKGCESFTSIYIDDVLIFSNSFEEHKTHLSQVFKCFSRAGVTVKFAKCDFAQPSLDFVGFEVGQGVMRPRQSKVKALLDAPRPETKRQLLSFQGFANYYSRFIPMFGKIAAPLYNLTKCSVKFSWDSVAESSLQQIKSILASDNVLLMLDYKKPIVL